METPLVLTHHYVEPKFFLSLQDRLYQQIENTLQLELFVNVFASVGVEKTDLTQAKLLLAHKAADLSCNARASLHHFLTWRNAPWCPAKAASHLLKIVLLPSYRICHTFPFFPLDVLLKRQFSQISKTRFIQPVVGTEPIVRNLKMPDCLRQTKEQV